MNNYKKTEKNYEQRVKSNSQPLKRQILSLLHIPMPPLDSKRGHWWIRTTNHLNVNQKFFQLN